MMDWGVVGWWDWQSCLAGLFCPAACVPGLAASRCAALGGFWPQQGSSSMLGDVFLVAHWAGVLRSSSARVLARDRLHLLSTEAEAEAVQPGGSCWLWASSVEAHKGASREQSHAACGSDVAPLWTAPRPCKSAAAGTMMLQAVNARVMDTLRRGVMRALILRNSSSLTPVNIFTTHPRSLIVCVLVCRRADARVGGCGRLGTPHGIRPTCILAPQRQADEQPGQ